MSTLASIAPKLTKLIQLLGSDIDGEALGAARAIDRTLEGQGLSLHDLAKLLEPQSALAAQRADFDHPIWAMLSRSDKLLWIRAVAEDALPGTWAHSFALSIAGQIVVGRSLSSAQAGKAHQLITDLWLKGGRL